MEGKVNISRVNVEDAIFKFEASHINEEFDLVRVIMKKRGEKIVCGVCEKEIDEKSVSKGMTCAVLSKKGFFLPCFLKLGESERNRCHLYHQSCLLKHLSEYSGSAGKVCESCKEEESVATEMNPPRLGIDVGGVIITSAKGGKGGHEDTKLRDKNQMEVKDSIESIRKLVEHFGEENVLIVSKAGKKMEGKTLEWFKANNFFDKTKLRRENVHFCKERHEKKAICEKNGINLFVDDRLDVLKFVGSSNGVKCFLFGSTSFEQHYPFFWPNVCKVRNWEKLTKLLLKFKSGEK